MTTDHDCDVTPTEKAQGYKAPEAGTGGRREELKQSQFCELWSLAFPPGAMDRPWRVPSFERMSLRWVERTIRSRRGSREEAVGVCQRFSRIANWLPDVESAILAEPGAQEGHWSSAGGGVVSCGGQENQFGLKPYPSSCILLGAHLRPPCAWQGKECLPRMCRDEMLGVPVNLCILSYVPIGLWANPALTCTLTQA